MAIAALLCATIAPAHALTEEEERAKAHFLAGQSYYEQASYADALREFNEAYRISKKPALLYNIARCHEGLEHFDDAIGMLERYLQEDPNTPDRAAIETRIANLEQRQAARILKQPSEPDHARAPAAAAPATTTAAGVQTSPPPPAHPRRRWTWVVGGVGVAALGAALGTGIASQLTYNDLNGKCTGGSCDPSAQGKIDRGRALALATDVLWPVGVAAVGVGVVLFFVEGRHAHR